MKKLFSLLLVLAVLFAGIITACGKSESGKPKSDTETAVNSGSGVTVSTASFSDAAGDSNTVTDKTIILYFSYSGNTEQIAKWVQEYTGAEMIRLEAAVPYPDDYDECVERAEAEHHEQARPELKTDVSGISDYDTIILGWPCWNYSCPMLIRTMLEKYDFSGKKIIPFTTSDISGFSGSLKEMKESSPNAVFEENGLEVRAKDVSGAKEKVNEWLSSLGFERR